MRSCLAAVLSAAALLAQGESAPWRVLADLRVDGAVAIDRDRLIGMLIADHRVQRLLKDPWSNRSGDSVAELAADLYRWNGFADVDVEWDAERRSLAVVEGPRRRCGGIVCTGNVAVPTEAIVGMLESESRFWPGWRAGDPAPSGDDAVEVAARLVKRLHASCGLYNAMVHVHQMAREDVLELHVDVRAEGAPTHVVSIALLGDRAADAEIASAKLKWSPGALFTQEMSEDLEAQVMALGRYISATLDLPKQAPERLDPLVIRVRPLPAAPPFADLDERGVERLRQAFASIGAHVDSGRSLRVGSQAPDELPVLISKGGVRISSPAYRARDGEQRRVDVLVGDGVVGIAIDDLRCELHVGRAVRVTASLGINEDGSASARLGCEMNWGESGQLFQLQMHPAAATYVMHSGTTEVRWDGDVLVWNSPFGVVRLGPDADWNVRGGEAESGPILELVDTGWDQACSSWREAHPHLVASKAAFLALLIERALPESIAPKQGKSAQLVEVAFASDVFDAPRADSSAARDEARPERAKWNLPPYGHAPSSYAGILLGLTSQPFANGWVRELFGVLGTLLMGRSVAAAETLSAFVDDPRHGPIALASAAEALAYAGFEGPSTRMRRTAGERWAFAAAYADVAEALAPFALDEWATRIGAIWRADARTAAMFADLPDGAQGDLIAWRRGLEVVWGEFLGEMLRARLLDED